MFDPAFSEFIPARKSKSLVVSPRALSRIRPIQAKSRLLSEVFGQSLVSGCRSQHGD